MLILSPSSSQPCTHKVTSYIESLVREIERLKGKISKSHFNSIHQINDSGVDDARHPETTDEPSHNPLVDEKPWFLPINSSKVPILLGDVADTVFATRFRQLITGQALSHIPRTSYPSDREILELAKVAIPHSRSSHARFLIRVALKFMDGSFHIVRKSLVSDLLDQYLHAPGSLDSVSTCKTFALFALGELHSSRSQSQNTQVPGLAYYSQASRVYGLLEERPCIDAIETSLILVSFYRQSHGWLL